MKNSEIFFGSAVRVERNRKFVREHLKTILRAETAVKLTIDLKSEPSGIRVVLIGRNVELVVLCDRVNRLASLSQAEVAILLEGDFCGCNKVRAVGHAHILPNPRTDQPPTLKNRKFTQRH